MKQMYYEIDNRPSASTPMPSSLSETELTDIGPDAVRVTGTRTPEATQHLVCMNTVEGYLGVGGISYGGEGALDRTRVAIDTVRCVCAQ